jgi:hypothetical protein
LYLVNDECDSASYATKISIDEEILPTATIADDEPGNNNHLMKKKL